MTHAPTTRSQTEPAEPTTRHGAHAPRQAIRPKAPAPARFGKAGLSADSRAYVKTSITLKRGPLIPRKRIEGNGIVSDYDHLGHGLARTLAGVSIALGIAELIAAGPIAKWLGMHDKRTIVRMHGAREVGHGLSILTSNHPRDRAVWVWARVAGDVLDAATLSSGLSRQNRNRHRVGYAMGIVAAVAVTDALCALWLQGSNAAK